MVRCLGRDGSTGAWWVEITQSGLRLACGLRAAVSVRSDPCLQILERLARLTRSWVISAQ